MSITSALVLYAVIWCMLFLMVLPFGQVSQQEAGEIVPGSPASAPTDAQIRRKMLITTVLSAAVWAIIFAIVYYELFTISDIPFLTPPSLR